MLLPPVGSRLQEIIPEVMNDDELLALDLSNWPAPDSHLLELGRISLLWNVLEAFLEMCLAKLAGFDDPTDPTPFILTKHMSVPQKMQAAETLCEQLVEKYPALQDYKRVMRQLEAAQRARNKFAHATMGINPNTGNVTMSIGSARGTLKTSTEQVDVASLRKAVAEIHTSALALYKLVLGREIKPIWEQRRGG